MVRVVTSLQKSASNKIQRQPVPVKRVHRKMELLKKEEELKTARQKIDKELNLHFAKLSQQYIAKLDIDQIVNSTPCWSTLNKTEQGKFREKFESNPECPTIPIKVGRFLSGEKQANELLKKSFLSKKLESLTSAEQWTLVKKYRAHGGSIKEFMESTMELNIPTLVIEEFFKQKGGNLPRREVLTPVPLPMEF